MRALLKLSAAIDAFNEMLGKLVMWLVLAAVLISAGNAVMRKAFDIGSNAYLEIQWYLFSAVFLLGSGYVWLRNAHVRIDFIASKLSKRTNTLIDIAGMLLFTVPLCVILIQLSWPVFERAWVSGEMSQNAGGLIRWPALLLIPAGFGVLLLQCASELIKRVAFLTGHRAEPMSELQEQSEEARLAEALAQKVQADARNAAAEAR
ncbi:TRAP transporter small permease subunit [Rubrivivax rivuli]|uniref:TRAP transporter small permease protein n=1 Tax=Rubrivivax rivuli TaxID=1862385 RepID=A0A437REK4_9BURK|nr:TRAP transporter small permease subunit [Rubrivivax rivuli]RVU45207.1 TRAP transporter small permease subunit [Rubrivivax rivuli]